MSTLPHSIILGADFCRLFVLIVDYKHDTWDTYSNVCQDNINAISSAALDSESYVKKIIQSVS